MFCEDVCLGATSGIDKIRLLSETLNAKAVDQVSGSQELMMLTSFAREANEYQFKQFIQDRISDVASWHWVLEDLSKRLEESINALKYEHNALRVVVKRVQEEMDCHCREGSRPGAICPLTDEVEEAVLEEFKFLRDQKKNFENLIEELDTQTSALEKTKKRIEKDILDKQKTLTVEEKCANKNYADTIVAELTRRKKGSPVTRWAKRCAALKRCGLKALYNAVIIRQQVRGARMRLSIAAQANAAKVDAVLRRRIHTNKLKLQDLYWQREEAVGDYNSLQEELLAAEKTVIETMNQEKVVAARIAERAQRPNRELTKDDVNRKLREEQNELRKFSKGLRNNIEDITKLQNNITAAVARIDCLAEDLIQVITLDEERMRCRLGETNGSSDSSEHNIITSSFNTASYNTNSSNAATYNTIGSKTAVTAPNRSNSTASGQLTVIKEENEDDDNDDYPFDI